MIEKGKPEYLEKTLDSKFWLMPHIRARDFYPQTEFATNTSAKVAGLEKGCAIPYAMCPLCELCVCVCVRVCVCMCVCVCSGFVCE